MQHPNRFRLLALLLVALGLLATTSVWAQDDDPTRPIYLPIVVDGEAGEGTLPGGPDATATPTPMPTATASPTPSPTPLPAWPNIGLDEVATDFDDPVYVTDAGEAGVLYIVEQRGVVQRYEMATGERSVFLDVEDVEVETACCGEKGLLSIALPG